jgi:hypothetical protein
LASSKPPKEYSAVSVCATARAPVMKKPATKIATTVNPRESFLVRTENNSFANSVWGKTAGRFD